MSERPPDPLRPGAVPESPEKADRNVSVLLVVVLLALPVIVVVGPWLVRASDK